MTTLRIIAATTLITASVFGTAPASAVITTFANYSGVGGANMYWSRSGTTYAVATPAHVAPPHIVSVTGTLAQKAAKTLANIAATNAYNVAIAAAASSAAAATAASQASAQSTAGGSLYTIATNNSTTPGSVATKFTFLNPILFALGPLNASFTFDAVSAPGNTDLAAGGLDIQAITSGNFSFIYTGAAPLVVYHTTYLTGANLLTASFTGGALFGQHHGSAATNGASTGAGDTIAYTSDFLTFINANAQDYSLSISGLITGLTPTGLGANPNQALNSFQSTTTGSFSSDPQPLLTAIIPEPAVWWLLVLGFGLVGFQARRRTSVAAVSSLPINTRNQQNLESF